MKTTSPLFLVSAAMAVFGLGCAAETVEPEAPGGINPGQSTGGSGVGGSGGLVVPPLGTGGTVIIDPGGSSTGTGLGDGIIRDFAWTFPDVRPCADPTMPGKTCASGVDDFGAFVGDTLGTDGRPLYLGEPVWTNGTLTTFGASHPGCGGEPCFNHWFRSDPVWNIEIPFHLEFTCPPTGGVCVFEHNEFFPIDDAGFGIDSTDPSFMDHNYGFTFEMQATFTYQPGLTFTFIGDDDVFVFINGHKVIDIGGIHPAATASVPFETLGLSAGQQCSLAFFFAERNPKDSHFRIEVSPEIVQIR